MKRYKSNISVKCRNSKLWTETVTLTALFQLWSFFTFTPLEHKHSYSVFLSFLNAPIYPNNVFVFFLMLIFFFRLCGLLQCGEREILSFMKQTEVCRPWPALLCHSVTRRQSTIIFFFFFFNKAASANFSQFIFKK